MIETGQTRTELLPSRRQDGWSAPHVVIWTVRRCGASGLESVFWGAYEPDAFITDPLSPGKRLAGLGARLAEEPERLDFYKGAAAMFATPLVLRQQLETASANATLLMLATAVLNRAAHIVLYRRNELKRLESMVVAQSTGYWGDGPAAKYAARIQEGEVTPAPVDLDELFRSSEFAIGQLRRIRASLTGTELPFVELCTEDLYARDNAEAVRRLRDGLAWRGLEYKVEDINRRLRTAPLGHRSARPLAKLTPDLPHFQAMAAERPELADITTLIHGPGNGWADTAPPARTRKSTEAPPLAALKSILPPSRPPQTG